MGNCFGFLKEYNKSNNIPVTNVPIGTPIYFDISNNYYNNTMMINLMI